MEEYRCYKNKVRFCGKNLTCMILSYTADDSVALQLVDDNFIPYVTATVYSRKTKSRVNNYCKDKHAAIKNYGENKGIEYALRQAGILKKRVGRIETGYKTVPIYEINTNPDDITKFEW